jgi:hypothetical protein
MHAASEMVNMNEPTSSERISVRNYLETRRRVRPEEQAYIYQEDLITLRTGRNEAPLNTVLSGLLRLVHCRLIEV